MQKVLFIGKIWPEPTSSAAGKRILQLVDIFIEKNFKVIFASTASKSEHSYIFKEGTVIEKNIQLNDASFNDFIKELQPNVVVFDRFFTEEQFGWRIREHCPQALTILDTEDLHFLREAREKAHQKEQPLNLCTNLAQREIASIYRCDVSLLISDKEIDLLTENFHINPKILFYLPFLENKSKTNNLPTFSARHDFVFIGNYLHQPNYQTVLELKKNVWPKLRKKLPHAALHIYGAYTSEKVYQLHNEKENFIIKGRAENALKTLSQYKILLAPIPFGAGAKGKLIDAMHSGTPSITTSMGAEGMNFNESWNGYITDNLEEFIYWAELLYQDEMAWEKAQKTGNEILTSYFNKEKHTPSFWRKVYTIQDHLSQHRQQNFVGEILKTNQLNANKYMSLWIEAKNKHK